MDPSSAENNPYAATPTAPASSPWSAPVQPRGNPFPVYALVMFIVSIIFCVLRLLIVVFGMLGVVMMLQQGADQRDAAINGLLEVATGAAMVFFGLLGNGLMLARKKMGYYFGWLLLLSVVGNILVGLAQLGTMFENLEPGSPEFIAGGVSLVLVLVIRVGIAVAYAIALLQFEKWIDRGSNAAAVSQPQAFG